MTFAAKDDYTVGGMLQFGYGHVDTACALYEDDSAFFESAGHLDHLNRLRSVLPRGVSA